MTPYLIFLLLIYIFYDIPKEDLFKKDNLITYCVVLFMFLSQNILFFIYPNLINEYRKIYVYFISEREISLEHFYLDYIVEDLCSIHNIHHFEY